jgi:tubulin polyglutamylase TTLL2
MYIILIEIYALLGWEEWDDSDPSRPWSLYWRSSRFKPSEYKDASPLQKMNHYPKSSVITKKDTLLRALRKMRVVHGKIFDFFPDGFILPTEYTKFVEEYSKQG